MAEPLYTAGVWTVIPGREEEFAAAWEEFARWSAQHASGSGWVRLLQDQAQPNRFLSVGPWESADAVEAWRSSEGFQQRITQMRPLLEAFEPGSYTERVALD